jgi:hypothetical protein
VLKLDNIIQYFLSYSIDELTGPLYRNPGSDPDRQTFQTLVFSPKSEPMSPCCTLGGLRSLDTHPYQYIVVLLFTSLTQK